MKKSFLLACTVLACIAAQADPALNVNRNGRIAGDGSGHGIAQRGGSFTTANGAEGARVQRLRRSEDGSVNAGSRAAISGDNGSASSSKGYSRSADGSTASAERNTSATNNNTGVTYDGGATWTKGEGVSRSGSCTDASGNTVTCGSAR